MEHASSSSSTAPNHNVEVVELNSGDLEQEYQRELEREQELHNLTAGIISTSEFQKKSTGKSKAILYAAEEEADEPTSPKFEPSYQALKLALSLSEGQIENKRRRMSAIDENRASGHNQGHIGNQLASEQEHLPLTTGMSGTPIYDELKHKEPAMIGNLGTPVTKAVVSPTSDCKPLVPSPLRNGHSSDEPTLTTMPTADEELSPSTTSEPRKFFKRRSLRSGSRPRAAPHTRMRQEAPNLPVGSIRGESPVVDTTKPPSPLSSLLAEASKRSGELRRRVSTAGGKKGGKSPLTRMQRQQERDLAVKTATNGVDAQGSPTAVLAAMLAVGATATAVPGTLQEEINSSTVPEVQGTEAAVKASEDTLVNPPEVESSSGFFRTRSMRSKSAKNIPKNEEVKPESGEEPAKKTIPAPLSFFRRQSSQSVTQTKSTGATTNNPTRLQAWGAAFSPQKTEPTPDTIPAVEPVVENAAVQAETENAKDDTISRFFKRRSMRPSSKNKGASSAIPTEQKSGTIPVTATESFVIPTKKNPRVYQPTGSSLETNPTAPIAAAPVTLKAFEEANMNDTARSAEPILASEAGPSTPVNTSIPRPISIGNPISGPPSPSPAQNPLEPKPRTHVHFSRKRGESDCTLCAPEYLQAGTIPAAAASGLPLVHECAPVPNVPMAAAGAAIGTRAMGSSQHNNENAAAKQAENDMRTSSFKRTASRIPRVMRGKQIGSGYRGFGTNTPTLRKQKSPPSPRINAEGAEKSTTTRRPRPVNPFRRNSRSAQSEPECPMLALALAPTPPTPTSAIPVIPEESPAAPIVELADTSATHVPKGTTPFSQQRFFRRRSLRNTPSTAAKATPPPLPPRDAVAEASDESAAAIGSEDVKTRTMRTSPHKRFFRARSKRNLREKSPAPLRKVAQRERFSLDDDEVPRSQRTSVGGKKKAGQWLKRRSLRNSVPAEASLAGGGIVGGAIAGGALAGVTLVEGAPSEAAVVEPPLHQFEELPRRISTEAGPSSSRATTGKGFKRHSLRSNAAAGPSSATEEAMIDPPRLHEFEQLPRRVSVPVVETGTVARGTKRKELRSRAVVRSRMVVRRLQRGSRRKSPSPKSKAKSPEAASPQIAVAAPAQEATSTLPTNAALGLGLGAAGLGGAGVISGLGVADTKSAPSKKSRLPIPLFSKRGEKASAQPRGPLRAPPALPPRNDPLVPTTAGEHPENETPATSTRGVLEDEITPAPVVENEKVDGNAAEAVESGLQYTREPAKLITYLIPLPMPVLKTGIAEEEDIQQRFLIYTPPAPHLLKPAPKAGERIRKRNMPRRMQREGKRRWGKRKAQEEVRKANRYSGKTVSFRGIHSKVTKGVVWAIRRIRPTDIVFLNRVNRKEVQEIHLIHPPSSTPIPTLRTSFLTQLSLTQRRAAKHSIISTLLLPITLVIDTVAVVIWPFGGLFEVDAVWWYSSIKGYHTSRSITKRLDVGDKRKENRLAKVGLGKYAGEKRELRLVFEGSGEGQIGVLERYVGDWCHKADPVRFASVGVPPSEGEVERCVGWTPLIREIPVQPESGKGKGKEERDLGGRGMSDEEVQREAFRADLRAVVEKASTSWRKRCLGFEKKSLKEQRKWKD